MPYDNWFAESSEDMVQKLFYFLKHKIIIRNSLRTTSHLTATLKNKLEKLVLPRLLAPDLPSTYNTELVK